MANDLYDERSAIQEAAQRPGAGSITTLPEIAGSLWEAGRLSETVLAEQQAREQVYDDLILSDKRLKGFRNPYGVVSKLRARIFNEEGAGARFDPEQGFVDEPAGPALAEAFDKRAREAGVDIPTAAEMEIRALERSAEAVAEAQDLSARGDVFADIGGFGVSTAVYLTDPLLLGSMMFGGGWTAPTLRFLLTEAAIIGGSEAAVQAVVQTYRKEAGIPGAGLQEGVINVLGAAIGGAALAGGIRALIRKVSKGRMRALTEAEEDAIDYVERRLALEGEYPYPGTPAARLTDIERQIARELRSPYPDNMAGRLAHIERMDEAMRALREGRAVSPAPRAHTVNIVNREKSLANIHARLSARAATQEGDAVVAGTGARKVALEIIAAEERVAVDVEKRGAVKIQQQANATARAREVEAQAETLQDFVAGHGGIRKEERGLLERVGLRGSRGITVDEAAKLATEAGFFDTAKGTAVAVPSDEAFTKALAKNIIRPRDKAPRASRTTRDLETLGRTSDDPGAAAATSRPGRAVGETDILSPEQVVAHQEVREAEMIELLRAGDPEQEFVMPIDGEMRTITSRELLETIEKDEEILAAFTECVG